MDTPPIHAAIRFGLGRRAGEALAADPRAWLLGQLAAPDPARFDGAPSCADGLIALREDRRERPPPEQRRVRKLIRAEAEMQTASLLTATAPFRERLVLFWANHFTVSLRQGGAAAVAGPFVREAIRPHVAGRFEDMLLAVVRHPAMLLYLDNAGSVGPDSPAGQRGHRGLNENLARECLELHTVSPEAGYTQADVTEFARVLTGWSIDLDGDPPGFLFRPRAHQPGPKTIMGQAFPPGETGGIAALRFLAAHPATHRHLARKLARHFVADDPAPDAVRPVEAALRDSGGDLGAAAAALVRLPQAWRPLGKLRSPQDHVVAALRALDLPADQRPDPPASMAGLGQPVWNAPLPNGWPDRAADWAGPEALLRRVDWAYGVAGRAAALDPSQVADASLGPLLRPATLDAMRHAGSRRDAMTLLLTSPEFLRR